MLEEVIVEEGAAEVEDGASAQLAPTHARPLHALLDQMFGRRQGGSSPAGGAGHLDLPAKAHPWRDLPTLPPAVSLTVHSGANRPDVLATVIPIENLHPLAAKGGGHVLPDSLGAIANNDHASQDRLLATTVRAHAAPGHDV